MISILIVKGDSENVDCYMLKKSKPVDLFLGELNRQVAYERWQIFLRSYGEININKSIKELFPSCFAPNQKKVNIDIKQMDMEDLSLYTKKNHCHVIFWDSRVYEKSDSEEESDESEDESDDESESDESESDDEDDSDDESEDEDDE